LNSLEKNTIYLTGNYIDQAPVDNPPYDDDDSELDSEDAYDLNDVSSDVEINPDDLEMDDDSEDEDSHRFEEVVEEKPKKKRERESDAGEAASDKLSKAEKKKLNKKLKANKRNNL